MSRIEHVRSLMALWGPAHDVLAGAPDRWLPRPLSMSGTTHFRGKLGVVGLKIDVAYVVQPPWRDGGTVSRHVHITPQVASLGRVECEIVLRRVEHGPLTLMFLGVTEPRGAPLARVLGPVADRLLLRRFVAVVTERMLRAATSRPEPYS